MLAVRFAVDQRGRGVNTDTVVVESAPQNGINCGYTFSLGERYVVYAHAVKGAPLTTTMCSGNKLAAEAAADLAFLKEIAGPRRGIRVFGQVRRVENNLASFSPRDYGGVAGVRVQAIGAGGSREAVTEGDGMWDFRDLRPGTYQVALTLPEGLRLAGPPLPREEHQPPITVTATNPSECAQVRAIARTDAQISGTLLNHDGRPAIDEPIDLIALVNAGSTDKQLPHVSVRTDPDGRFTFAFIAPGQYLVGVNLKDPPPASQVDRRAYHPGVVTPATATVVPIDGGGLVELPPFALPQWPVDRRFSVVVVWEDGGPAPDANVTLSGARPERVPPDAGGRFTVVLPYGAQFSIQAQSARIVDGRRVSGSSRYQQIGRNDRESEITLVLKPSP
jgi:hypothetical protein